MARPALNLGAGHAGAADRPHLVVTACLDDPRDQTGVGYLPGSGTLPIADVRRIACDCKSSRSCWVCDGQPLDVGRTTRSIPPAIRTALNVREQGCRGPGCDWSPSACEAHHVQSWLDEGPTSVDNLLLICAGHHRKHHKGEITITAQGSQQFTMTKTPRRMRT